jgi:hypothetical protein
VERVLQSATFRNSPTSRRLLRYLADHSIVGRAEQLKEYTVGVDAFGKAADYDPRQDSTVRIQMSRLRQKLADYYREEGKDDAFIIDLPKGHFILSCEMRARTAAPVVEEAAPPASKKNTRRSPRVVLVGVSVLVAGLAVFGFAKLRGGGEPPRAQPNSWSPELEQVWQHFIQSSRPLIIAVGNPLFFQFENRSLYRELSIENPEDLVKSRRFEAVSKALKGQESRPVRYYAAVGDVSAAFLLGQRLGPYQPRMSVVRSSQLQWQQLADANVIFLGPPRFFGDRLASLPVSLEITEVSDGFQNVHPQPGEPALFNFRDPTGFFTEDGEACVLITHAPGPVGNTDVITFASNSTFGRVGAIDAFTDREFARTLVAKMGRIPRYYQVLLKVKYKGGVPTQTSYLLHRELRRR